MPNRVAWLHAQPGLDRQESTFPDRDAPESKTTSAMAAFVQEWGGQASPPAGALRLADRAVKGFGESQFALVPQPSSRSVKPSASSASAAKQRALGGSGAVKNRSSSDGTETAATKTARTTTRGHHRRRSSFELTELDILRLRPFIRAINDKV